MINKFNGKCSECGAFCKAGTANWFAGHGVVCDRCNGFDSAATKADPHTYAVPAPVVVVAPVISEQDKRAAEIERVESALEVNRRMVRMMRESGRAYAPIAYAGYEQQIAKLEAELAALQPVVVVEEEIVTEEELAAAEAEVDAVETAEAAEIAASEDAIEIAPVVVAQPTTLRLYRMAVLCKTCFLRTKAAALEIAHHSWCHTREQSPELLRTLQDKVAMSLIKRRETKAAKLNAKIDDLREAFSAIYNSVGGNSALGIHKISGSTGLHTVRAYEGTCTCPGHKAHGHCKHVRLVREAREAMKSIKTQLRDTSDRLLMMEPRATEANAGW